MRCHKVSALPYAKLPDHRLVSSLQHLDDLAISSSIPLDARNANHYAVAMHGRFCRFARDVNVALQALDGMIGDQKPVPVAVHVQAAYRVFPAQSRDDKMPGTNFYELTALDQPIQRAFQLITRNWQP